MKHKLLKLLLLDFLVGVTLGASSTSGDPIGSSVVASSTATDLPTSPVLEDDLPLTFKVVTSKTEAPATTPPPFVTAKPARTLHLVTGGTDSPAASPDSTANLDEAALSMGAGRSGSVPVSTTAIVPAETMRIVTGRSTKSPSSVATTPPPWITSKPAGSDTASPSALLTTTGATMSTPISPTTSTKTSPSATTVATVDLQSPDKASSTSTVTTQDNIVSGASTATGSTSTTSGAHSAAGQEDALASPTASTGRDQEISGLTQVTKGDGNFRDVVSSTALISSDGAGSVEESDRNDTTSVSSHVLSSGSVGTNSTIADAKAVSSTETSNSVGSERDVQPNRLDSNAGSRAVVASVLLWIVMFQAVL